jgi:hypothetical protein
MTDLDAILSIDRSAGERVGRQGMIQISMIMAGVLVTVGVLVWMWVRLDHMPYDDEG